MTDIESRLEQAMKVDDLASHDPLFRIGILVRRERAAARRRVLSGVTMALGIAILAALGLIVVGKLIGTGAEPPMSVTAAIAMLAVLLAASYAGGLLVMQSFFQRWRQRIFSSLQIIPGRHLWY
jgi:hypothetical protein